MDGSKHICCPFTTDALPFAQQFARVPPPHHLYHVHASSRMQAVESRRSERLWRERVDAFTSALEQQKEDTLDITSDMLRQVWTRVWTWVWTWVIIVLWKGGVDSPKPYSHPVFTADTPCTAVYHTLPSFPHEHEPVLGPAHAVQEIFFCRPAQRQCDSTVIPRKAVFVSFPPGPFRLLYRSLSPFFILSTFPFRDLPAQYKAMQEQMGKRIADLEGEARALRRAVEERDAAIAKQQGEKEAQKRACDQEV